MSMKKKWYPQSGIAVMIATLALLFSATNVFAQNTLNPYVFAPNSHPYGHNYSQWSTLWWQYALSTPNFNNCQVNQQPYAPIWFMAGTVGTSGSTMRSCTVPFGKSIMFPMFTAEQSLLQTMAPGSVYGCSLPTRVRGASVKALQACATAYANHVNVLEASVDGIELQHLSAYRFTTGPFAFLATPGNAIGAPAGFNYAAADGYWIILQPLMPGLHVIHLHGGAYFPELQNFISTTDVVYNITVV